ncbi:MAG: hypothetical protein NT062_30015 [Proteobacteria bacterium]|nr:hypothetical protein [Pseudomonadota bacterium]
MSTLIDRDGNPARLDAADVRAAVKPIDVFAYFDWKFRPSGSQFRLAICPRCGEQSSGIAVARDGSWIHHGHEHAAGGTCSGDALNLVAAFAGLDTKRDFVKVLELAAEIAGVEAQPLSEPERAQRRADRDRAAADRQRQDDLANAAALREAKLKAAMAWKRMLPKRWSLDGDAHLRRRGFDGPAVQRLVDHDYVRLSPSGDLCIPMWSYADGELVNVARRVLDPKGDDPKTPVLSGCPITASLVGRVQEIRAGDTVITEGITDTLTAVIAWPNGLAIGAHSAGQLGALVAAAAPRVKACGGRLLLVPDRDARGEAAAKVAIPIALEAGLRINETLIIVDVKPHKDLNEALVAGWKP